MLMEFEKATCGRCGGTGHYSYNQITGTTCFKCHGAGKVLTRRGHAAWVWLQKQQATRYDEIAPGDYIDTGSSRFVVDVVYQDLKSSGKSLQPDGTWKEHAPSIHISPRPGSKCPGYTASPDHTVRRIGRAATWKQDKNAWLRKAFEYQDTLTKMGKPRKTTPAKSA